MCTHGIQLDNNNQLQSLNYQHITTLYRTTNYLLSHDTNTHIRVLSHSIKVAMAELCCGNDCISIGMTLDPQSSLMYANESCKDGSAVQGGVDSEQLQYLRVPEKICEHRWYGKQFHELLQIKQYIFF